MLLKYLFQIELAVPTDRLGVKETPDCAEYRKQVCAILVSPENIGPSRNIASTAPLQLCRAGPAYFGLTSWLAQERWIRRFIP